MTRKFRDRNPRGQAISLSHPPDRKFAFGKPRGFDYLCHLVSERIMTPKSSATPNGGASKGLLLCVAMVATVLGILFFRAFHPDYVVFSNDGPLGGMVSDLNRMPGILTGIWQDLNWLGGSYPQPFPDATTVLRLVTSPVVYAKIFAPFSLFFVGICAWLCFRQYKFSTLTCLLVALAAALNSDFVGTSAWGVCGQAVAFGMNFLALGALADTTSPRRWLRVMLAGFAVGLGVTEAYDIGALFSMFTGAYVVVQSFVCNEPVAKRLANGLGRLAIVGACAGLIAAAALSTLVGTQIKGVAGTGQDAESKAVRWSFATQYSIPKAEALGILVPGLFGFRFDTPDGGAYWGRAGSDLAWDDYLKSDRQGPPPRATFRAGAGSNYAGILVVLLAAFGVAQSFRKQGGPFPDTQRKLIWFWCVVLVVALLLMFGRFAPFYQFFYALPYVSTIRNPAKFLHIAEWALLILFAYGAEALWRAGFSASTSTAGGLTSHWKTWWKKAAGFNRNWVLGSVMVLAVFCLAWLLYASSRGTLEKHLLELTTLQYGGRLPDSIAVAESANAAATARHSVGQVGRTLLFLVPAVGLVALALSGYFAGRRAMIGGVLFVAVMIVDLLPVNRHWIRTPNWKEKYEANSVIEFLRQRSYEHRVILFPPHYVDFGRLPREMMPMLQQYQLFAQLYGAEWTQHLFPYYNIQTLDIVQEPRVASDKAAYEAVLEPRPLRRWELTNTRYLIGPTAFLDFLNQQFDAGRNRFRIALQFNLAAKPYASPAGPTAEQITTVISTNGQLALFEFTGALPRASLFSNWKVSTNDPALLQEWVKRLQQSARPDMGKALASQSLTDLATLHELADPAFNPAQTVLLAEPLPVEPGTNQNPSEVKYESYAPKHSVLSAKANEPSVLLLNDKYDPNWKVTVNGQPAKLLRANFIVRGVFLDKPGEHRVEFKFQPPLTGLYISLGTVIVGLALLGYIIVAERKHTSEVESRRPAGKK